MANIQLSFRLPAGLVKEIDRYMRHLKEKTPGALISRADVVRELLTAELARRKPKEKKPNE